MRTQRLILIAAVVLGLGYAWVRGGFVGLRRSGCSSGIREGDVCWGLLLVCRGRLRQSAGCHLHDVRIHRRSHEQSNLRAGLTWRDGAR